MNGCLITLKTDGDAPFDIQLGEFLADNNFSSEELQEMFRCFGSLKVYQGGGGASVEWSVEHNSKAHGCTRKEEEG